MKLCIKIRKDDSGRFTALCPSLPGCMTKGETREEARQRIDEAIRGYIASVNNFVPENIERQIIET